MASFKCLVPIVLLVVVHSSHAKPTLGLVGQVFDTKVEAVKDFVDPLRILHQKKSDGLVGDGTKTQSNTKTGEFHIGKLAVGGSIGNTASEAQNHGSGSVQSGSQAGPNGPDGLGSQVGSNASVNKYPPTPVYPAPVYPAPVYPAPVYPAPVYPGQVAPQPILPVANRPVYYIPANNAQAQANADALANGGQANAQGNANAATQGLY